MVTPGPLEKKGNQPVEICSVPRWQILKAGLDNLDYDQFVANFLKDPKGICLDVRTKEEFEQNGISQALNLNYLSSNLADQLELLDSEKNYYVYCRTGRRSLRVCVLLQNMGFTVYNLEDGLSTI